MTIPTEGTRIEFTEPMGGIPRSDRHATHAEVIVPATVQGVVLRESEAHPGHVDVLTDDMSHPTYGDRFDSIDVPFAHPDQFRVVESEVCR